MVDPYSTDDVQLYHDPWYTFHDGFLEFNTWSTKRALEKQKDLVLLEVFKGSDINEAWFPLLRDVMRARLERRDLLPVPIHFAFPSSKMEDWSGWVKEMLVENGFVEILHAVRILKSVTMTLEDVANLMLLPIVGEEDPRHIMLTLEEPATLVALKKVMRRNTSASSRSWRGEYSIDFPTWMWYFPTSEGKDSLYVCAAFLTAWLSKFVFGGFPNHVIMAECIPLEIQLVEGVKLPLALLMLGTLYHMLDLLHFDEILGASYYIIESHVCLSLLQMFAWERFRLYHSGCVTSGKALKEYPMAKCEVDGLLDDYGGFNFHAYKTMPRTFAPPKVSLFDKALPAIPESQIVEFTIGNSSHLEMLAMITPSMLPCITLRGTWSLECYCPEKVATPFGYDQDVLMRTPKRTMRPTARQGIFKLRKAKSGHLKASRIFLALALLTGPPGIYVMALLTWYMWGHLDSHHVPSTPSSNKTNWNRAMQPYIDEVATTMVPICPPIPGMAKEEYDQAGAIDEEFGQKAAGDVDAEGADEAVPSKRLVLGKRKSVAHLPKSRARRTSASLASKPSKAKVPTLSKAKTAKEKDTSRGNESNESSWGDPDPEVIEQIKRLRPVCGGRRLGEKYYDSSALFQVSMFEGFGLIPIPGDDKVLSKAKEAKQVEALANSEVCQKILANQIGGSPLPDNIFNVVDSIIDWSDPTSFIAESTKKAKANDVLPQKRTMTKGGVKVSYGTPSVIKKPKRQRLSRKAGDLELVPGGFIPTRKIGASIDEKDVENGEAKATIGTSKEKGKKVTKVISSYPNESSSHQSSSNDASFESENGSKQRGKVAGFQGSIDMNRAAPKEFKSYVGDVVRKSVSSKGKMDIGMPVMISMKKVAGPSKVKHNGQLFATPAKSGKIDDSAMRLLKNFDEMNEDRDVSLARFGLVPLSGSRAVGRFAVPAILEPWARHLLNIFPNLTTRNKAKKDFYYLFTDAFDDAESINLKVDALRTHLSNLAKAYLGKTEFDTAEGDTAEGLDKRIKEQAKHIKEMKSLAKTRELVIKLEEGLVSAKAYLGLLNQEKEHLDSNGMTELR
ncbi:hypothetical protein SLEP1_g50470 [Rubroshorea leprosula]|uniref:Aminotransferase-like plant mobile domain-containing protein n=1 Tax=Rubroshorea leprosula TaxID=152421 RepID=A0AAV5M3I5_9ROSI|nr:hypothetical protein SLEP1_g50470 [Rubroshorea leprosula]